MGVLQPCGDPDLVYSSSFQAIGLQHVFGLRAADWAFEWCKKILEKLSNSSMLKLLYFFGV